MLYKIVGVGSWDRMDVEPVQVIKVARNGLGPQDRHDLLVKRAASHIFANLIDRGEIRNGDIPIHITALGATEGYGFNRNGDGFKEAWCRAHHDSFVKHACLYRNHKNKDASKRYGNVKLSTYCEPMRRVELLVIGNGTKEAAERNGGLVLPDRSIEQLLSGKPLEYSMACSIVSDKCANCGNEAPSRAQYCTEDSCVNPHTGYRGFGCREGLTKVAEDGFMQGVDNPNPKWFDISEVGTHADRIAYGGLATYLKQAGVPVFGGAELAEQMLPLELLDPFSVQPSGVRQQRVLSKVAAIESSLRDVGPTPRDKAFMGGVKQAEVETFSRMGEFGGLHFEKALRALSDASVVLSFGNFAKWACRDNPHAAINAVRGVSDAIPFSFVTLLFSDDMERQLANNAFVPSETTLHKYAMSATEIAEPLSEMQTKRAAMLSVLQSPPRWNAGNRNAVDANQDLVTQYALYKLAFLTEHMDDENFDALCRLAVLQNFVM